MTDIAAIAKGLTGAQRDWLRNVQPDRLLSPPGLMGFDLDDAGVTFPTFCPIAREFGHGFTKTGLAVRPHLKGQE